MPDFNWNIPLPLHFGQAETPQMSLARALPDEPLRPVFEAFIQQRFRKAHGCRHPSFHAGAVWHEQRVR